MSGCGLIGFDLGACAWGIVSRWTATVPWWAWALAALVVVVVAWKLGGWPALLALAAGAGFVLGRRSVHEPDEIWPDPDPKPQKRPKVGRPTIFDWRRK